MSTKASDFALGGYPGERGWLGQDDGGSSSALPNVIAEVTASAAQWNFRIDELLAHLDAVADTIDFLEQRDVRIALRRALKEKRRALQQAGRDLTRQVRTLSRFAAIVSAT
jgi:hypothetical protein